MKWEVNIKRLHGINNDQLLGSAKVGHQGVSNLSNEDLLRFGGPQGNDPIRGWRAIQLGDDYALPGSRINITGGHHRLWEIKERARAGKIPLDTIIEAARSQ